VGVPRRRRAGDAGQRAEAVVKFLVGDTARQLWADLGAPSVQFADGQSYWRGFVYLIEAIGAKRVKVGWSKNPHVRRGQLQVHSPHRLQLLAAVEGTQTHEAWMHWELMAAHHRGEWFHIRTEIREFAEVVSTIAKEKPDE
jgi:hypothetical protein